MPTPLERSESGNFMGARGWLRALFDHSAGTAELRRRKAGMSRTASSARASAPKGRCEDANAGTAGGVEVRCDGTEPREGGIETDGIVTGRATCADAGIEGTETRGAVGTRAAA